jgi:hypothetical protein
MGIIFNIFTGEFDYTGNGGGGTPTNSFTTFQTPQGSSPTATSPTDTLTFTSSDSSIDIVGNSGTDTIDLKVANSFVDLVSFTQYGGY